MPTWKIQGKTSEHTVVLNRGVNIRDTMSLVLDGKKIATLQIPSSSLIAKMEYTFTCEDEPVTLVLFGQKADLVANGIFQDSKRKYTGNSKIGWWFFVLMTLLNFAAAFVFQWRLIACAMAAACSVLTGVTMLSPFQSKARKVIFSFLLLLWCWGIACLSWYWQV